MYIIIVNYFNCINMDYIRIYVCVLVFICWLKKDMFCLDMNFLKFNRNFCFFFSVVLNFVVFFEVFWDIWKIYWVFNVYLVYFRKIKKNYVNKL